MSIKSIIQKLAAKIILASLVGAIIALCTIFATSYFTELQLHISTILLSLIIIAVSIILSLYISLIVPLNKVIHEMKALLTGKRYKRVFTKRKDEIGIIAHFFNEITKNLERISSDLNEHKRISKELDIAHQIQQNLLPQSAPKVDGLDIIAKTKPAEEIGGDSFDFMETDDNLFFYLGDVTGHGVPAGLVMIMVDTLLDTFIDKGMNTKDVLINTNKYLQPKISATMFMTMVMCRWDKKNKKLYYTGAGHEHILIYRAKTKTCEAFKAGGIALGMLPDNSSMLEEKEIEFNNGDALVLYSDGITEGENSKGELYGLERLKKSVEKHASIPGTKYVFEGIAKDFSTFIEDTIQDDDMSLFIIQNTNN